MINIPKKNAKNKKEKDVYKINIKKEKRRSAFTRLGTRST